MTTVYLSSLKRELSNHWRYAVTVKDTEGDMWVLCLSDWNGLTAIALHKESDKPLNLDLYLSDAKSHKEIQKRVQEMPASFWIEPLEDCEEGHDPVTLNKKTLESICIGLNYGTEKIKITSKDKK